MESLFQSQCRIATISLLMAFSSTSWSATTTLNFDYVATNLHGGSGLSRVASLTVTDLSDLGLIGEGFGGVRLSFKAENLSQFASGVTGTKVWISAFELNFPDTSPENGYELNNQHWAHVDGVNLGSGIEWQEDGAVNGWGAGVNDPAFGQEYNFAAESMLEGLGSTIDVYNTNGFSGFSVANLLNPENFVKNATASGQPDALAWIKLRGTGNADPGLRGIATNGFWGKSDTGGNPIQNRVNVLAVAEVPVPGAGFLFASVLGLMGLRLRRLAD